MVKAYVFIGVEGINPHKAAVEATKIKEVENVDMISGEYDLMAIVKSKTLVSLRELALDKIGRVKGVVKTSTLIVADE
jgi:DNA-binding Lrp family transcriptional regulator